MWNVILKGETTLKTMLNKKKRGAGVLHHMHNVIFRPLSYNNLKLLLDKWKPLSSISGEKFLIINFKKKGKFYNEF